VLAALALALLAAPTADVAERLRAARLEAPARTEALKILAASLGVADALGDPVPDAPGPLRVELVVDPGARRLLVSVDDPSGLLDRFELVHRRPGAEPARLASVSIRDGSRSAPLPLGWPGQGRLEVELGSSLVPGGPLWRREVPAPAAPPSLATAPAVDSVPPAAEPVVLQGGPPPWAWIALSAVTAGLVGAAVWQETR